MILEINLIIYFVFYYYLKGKEKFKINDVWLLICGEYKKVLLEEFFIFGKIL